MIRRRLRFDRLLWHRRDDDVEFCRRKLVSHPRLWRRRIDVLAAKAEPSRDGARVWLAGRIRDLEAKVKAALRKLDALRRREPAGAKLWTTIRGAIRNGMKSASRG